MKRAILVVSILFVMSIGTALQPSFVFAQTAEEQAKLAELQTLVVQLLELVLSLQEQLVALQSNQNIPVAPIFACAQAEIEWEKVSGATGYVLYRNGIEVFDGRDREFVDVGLRPGATYAYTVRAKNKGGLGLASPVETITTPFECPPQEPFVWADAGVCGGTVQLTWTRPSGAQFYEVYRGRSKVFTGSTLFFLDRGSAGRKYTYTVRAGGAGGWGDFSEQVTAHASGVCPPAAPLAPEVGSPLIDDVEPFAAEGLLRTSINSRPNNTTIRSEKSANILSFKVNALLSSMEVERVDVEFTDRPWQFLSEVELRDGSRTVARVSVTEGSFGRVGDNKYSLSFTGLNIAISKNKSKTLSVRVTAKEDLRLAEPREMTVSIPQAGIRTRDQIDVTHSGPSSAEAPLFVKTFFVDR